MTTLALSTLLPPLQNAIAMRSWEDAEDIAGELKRLARLKRLSELQAIQEQLTLKQGDKIAPEVSQVANQPLIAFNSEIAYRQQVSASELLKALADPVKAKAAQEAGWKNLEEIAEAAGIAYRPEPEITIDTRFDEKGHDEGWRNDVACELNWLIGLAKSRQRHYEIDYVAAAAVSIAKRVAEFEGIKTL